MTRILGNVGIDVSMAGGGPAAHAPEHSLTWWSM